MIISKFESTWAAEIEKPRLQIIDEVDLMNQASWSGKGFLEISKAEMKPEVKPETLGQVK